MPDKHTGLELCTGAAAPITDRKVLVDVLVPPVVDMLARGASDVARAVGCGIPVAKAAPIRYQPLGSLDVPCPVGPRAMPIRFASALTRRACGETAVRGAVAVA